MSEAAVVQEKAPKRPLSSYNLFFLVERKRILEGVDGLNLPVKLEEVRAVAKERESAPRRRHRKSHGKISFKDLAKTLAGRWKMLDAEKRHVFEAEAKVLWAQYEDRMREWNTRTELSEVSSKPATKTKKKKHSPQDSGPSTGFGENTGGVVRTVSVQGSPSQEGRKTTGFGIAASHHTPVASISPASNPVQSPHLSLVSGRTGETHYFVEPTTNGQSVSDSCGGLESETDDTDEEGRAHNQALDQAKRLVQQSIQNYTLGPHQLQLTHAHPYDIDAEKRKVLSPAHLPKKKPRVQEHTVSSPCYRFDLNDPVEVARNRVQFTVRGKPRSWKPPSAQLQVDGGLALLTTGKEELRDVTECLLKLQAGGATPKFEANQMLSATLVFAFPTQDDLQVEGIDLYAKFVLDAFSDLLFDHAGQVVSLHSRKTIDKGGSGYTSLLLEADPNFSSFGGNVSGV